MFENFQIFIYLKIFENNPKIKKIIFSEVEFIHKFIKARISQHFWDFGYNTKKTS